MHTNISPQTRTMASTIQFPSYM